jgi:DNA-binding transcriptional LysR family regulator
MELRHLRYFVAVAEELHFGRAAARVGVAQPALSKQIQSLEAELGVRLLERTRRKVALTDPGRLLLGEARLLLAQADRVELLAERAARGESGHLALGFTPVALYGALPPLLRAFGRSHPDVTLTLHELWTPDLVEALRSRLVQVGVARLPIVGDWETLPLRRDRLVVALPADHPLADQPRLRVRDLAADRFVLFQRHLRPDFYDELVALCRREGFSPRIGEEATTEPTIVGLVAAGQGVAFLPEAYRTLQRPEVVYRDLEGDIPVIRTVLVWRPDDPSPPVRAFVDSVRGSIAEPLA